MFEISNFYRTVISANTDRNQKNKIQTKTHKDVFHSIKTKSSKFNYNIPVIEHKRRSVGAFPEY